MMKIKVRLGGKRYVLREQYQEKVDGFAEDVVVGFKKGVLGLACASFLVLGLGAALVDRGIDEDSIVYEQVFISSVHDSEYKTVSDAIVKLNSGVDYRKLLGFFEDANDVSSGSIVEGYYLVPIYTKE